MAVCAHRPQIGNPTFVYVPRAANVLRERERHIGLLGRGTRAEGRLAGYRPRTNWRDLQREHEAQELKN